MERKFVFNDTLYQAKIENGDLVITDLDNEQTVGPNTLGMKELKTAAEQTLAAKPRFELISVWGRHICHEFFVSYEAAFATMLAELKEELEDNGVMEETVWENVLDSVKSNRKVELDGEFGISPFSAWSSLDIDTLADWKIFDLEDEEK